jgi:hypothetical protein
MELIEVTEAEVGMEMEFRCSEHRTVKLQEML